MRLLFTEPRLAAWRDHGGPTVVVAERRWGAPYLFRALAKEAEEGCVWLERALTTFDEEGLGGWQLRLHIVYNWVYVRILIGETVGLQETLLREVETLGDAYPALAAAFRSTLGDYFLSQGRPRAALAYYLDNVNFVGTAPRPRLSPLLRARRGPRAPKSGR